MSGRQIDVIHALVAREGGDGPQWLFFPHGRWSAGSGEPLLALPAKKVQRRGQGTNLSRSAMRRSMGLLCGEIGLGQVRPAGALQSLVELPLLSPTAGVPTDYRIAPLALPLDPGAARRLGGVWMSADEAMARPDLSPTARLVLAATAGGHDLSARLFGPVEGDERTRRLAEARWDDRLFGPLFEEMRPWLTDRLRSESKTQALFGYPGDVDDALGDAALNALTGLPTFDPTKGTAEGWLWVITRNAGITILRQRKRHRGPRFDGDDGRLVAVAMRAEDPAERALGRERLDEARRRLDAALARLPDPVRRAWEAYQSGDVTYEALSAETGVPIGTLANKFHQVRQATREVARS